MLLSSNTVSSLRTRYKKSILIAYFLMIFGSVREPCSRGIQSIESIIDDNRQELHASPRIEHTPILSYPYIYPYMVMSYPYMDMWAMNF